MHVCVSSSAWRNDVRGPELCVLRGITGKRDHMIDLEPDADFLADGMVMVRRHQRQHLAAGWQFVGLEEFGAATRLAHDLGQ